MSYPRQPSIFLSDEHDAFRDTVAAFVDREIRPHADEWERAGECARGLYKKAGDAGLLGLRYAEDLGGSNMDFLATAVLAEELAKGDSIGTAVSLMAQSEFALAILADEASDDVAGFSIGAGTSEIMRELISRSLVASQTHKETR